LGQPEVRKGGPRAGLSLEAHPNKEGSNIWPEGGYKSGEEKGNRAGRGKNGQSFPCINVGGKGEGGKKLEVAAREKPANSPTIGKENLSGPGKAHNWVPACVFTRGKEKKNFACR